MFVIIAKEMQNSMNRQTRELFVEGNFPLGRLGLTDIPTDEYVSNHSLGNFGLKSFESRK